MKTKILADFQICISVPLIRFLNVSGDDRNYFVPATKNPRLTTPILLTIFTVIFDQKYNFLRNGFIGRRLLLLCLVI